MAKTLAVMERWLYIPALTVGAFCAVVIAASPFVSVIHTELVRPSTYVAAGVTVVLFFRMLFDPRCRRSINAVNLELRGDRPWPGGRWVRWSDPQWGFFGSRTGPVELRNVRAILFGEFILALLLSGRSGSDVLVLSSAAVMVVTMLTIIHVGLNAAVAR